MYICLSINCCLIYESKQSYHGLKQHIWSNVCHWIVSFFGYGMFQICMTQLWIQCHWVQLYVWYVIDTRLRYSTCSLLYSMAASRSHGTMTPKRNSDTSWAKSTEIYGSAYLAGPYIYINTYKFAVPPIFWRPETKWNNLKLKTPKTDF